MELKDTIQGMTSKDYRDRFVAEYNQLAIRRKKLKRFCQKIKASRLSKHYNPCEWDKESKKKVLEEPDHDTPFETLEQQLHIMGEYMNVLEVRAEMEGISLD